ncbi:MAG TPA: dihydrodipicolinate reductase C-terminal domain-containing protein, partial [Streptosporangiaceae bacterium]
MPVIKVGVLGARGRMGSLVCDTVRSAEDLEFVAGVDVGDSLDALAGCDVVVDFTSPDVVMGNLHWCIEHGMSVVIGTSGFSESRLAQVRELLRSTPDESELPAASAPRVLVVPNFSVGAVLMMQFAEQAARFFESVEIIELHHAGKIDAPSGTAVRTAAMIAAARSAAGVGPSPDATTT